MGHSAATYNNKDQGCDINSKSVNAVGVRNQISGDDPKDESDIEHGGVAVNREASPFEEDGTHGVKPKNPHLRE